MRHIAILAIAGMLTGCSSAATPTTPAPIAAVQSRTGTWAGMLLVTSCSGGFDCQTGAIENFTLRLAPDGSAVAQIAPSVGQSFAVDLVGSSTAEGGWTATGSLSVPARSRVTVEFTLSALDATAISGTVRYTINSGSSNSTRSARVVASRAVTTTRPGPFQGRWTGFVERTSCTGTCNDDTMFGYLVDFEMEISQALSSLEGSMIRFGRFRAVANGASFTLSASHGTPDDPGCVPQYYGRKCYVEVRDMNVTVDKLDRMHGTFSYRVQGYTDTGSAYSSVSGTARLVGVVRWP